MKSWLIIDTDAGVDDAVALLMALRQSRFAIAAITTVYGNIPLEQAVQNVNLFLDICGKEVPVYRGAAAPLNGRPLSASDLMGADGIGGVTRYMHPSAREIEAEPAALALARMARECSAQGDVTLVALGPLTNLALAVRLDPLFSRKVSRLFIMGGTHSARGNASAAAEFNFLSDPEAAAIVLRAGFEEVWILPWETSVDYPILWNDWEKLISFKTPLALFAGEISTQLHQVLRYGLKTPGMLLPDPLAMAAALSQDVIKESAAVCASVETCGQEGRGLMAINWREAGTSSNCRLITGICQDVFMDMCCKTFGDPIDL